MTRVLLTDGGQRSTLAAVRALGRAGVEVYVGAPSVTSLASRSKYCKGTFAYPSAFEDERGFVEAIAGTAARLRADLVMPMTDITCAVLASERTAISAPTVVAVPDTARFWRASDKIELQRLAERLGVPTPATTYVPAGVRAPGQTADVRFPCVVKPARSVVRTSAGWAKTAVLWAHSRAELDGLLRDLQQPCMIQEVIAGDGVGIFALCEHGNPRILFAHRRLREKPPWGGVSVLREAVAPDPAVAKYASEILCALKWHGVAMVEFKRDRSSGTPYLMEVNARFWGSLQLAVDAGVDFPVEAVNLWLGRPVSRQPAYRTGLRSRWLLGDLDHLLLRLSAAGPKDQDAPPLGTVLLDFVNVFRRDTRCEVESWRDPGPSVEEIRTYVRDLYRSWSSARG